MSQPRTPIRFDSYAAGLAFGIAALVIGIGSIVLGKNDYALVAIIALGLTGLMISLRGTRARAHKTQAWIGVVVAAVALLIGLWLLLG